MLILSTTSIYAGEAIIQNNQLTIPEGEKAFSVQLQVKEADSYAGAELGVDLTKGLEIKSIKYGIDQDYMNIGPVQNSAGTYYFGYFDGENKFSGDYTITLDLEKIDETIKEASISLKALNITRLDADQNVTTNKKSLDQQAHVTFHTEQVPIQEEIVVSQELVVPQEIPNNPPKQKAPETKPVVDKQPQVEPKASTDKKEMSKVEVKEPQDELTQPIEEEPVVESAPVPEKEIIEVKTPLPYSKLSFGAILIAGVAFFIGRFTKKENIGNKVNLSKEDKHDQQL